MNELLKRWNIVPGLNPKPQTLNPKPFYEEVKYRTWSKPSILNPLPSTPNLSMKRWNIAPGL
jgi:hypothetical protein